MEVQYIKVNDDGQVDAQVKVIFIQDGDYIVAYSPALNLAASGESEKKAKDSFSITLKIFVDDLLKKGLLEAELESLGWQVKHHDYTRNMTAEEILTSMPNFIGQKNLQYANVWWKNSIQLNRIVSVSI